MRKYLLDNKKTCLLELYDGSALFIASYIMQILFQFVFTIILATTKVSQEFTRSLPGACIIGTLNALAMVLTPFVYSKIKGEKLFVGSGFTDKIGPLQLLICFAIGIAVVIANTPIANAVSRFVVWTGYDISNMAQLNVDSWSTYIIALIFMVIIPPICEEFLYRGMISRAYGDRGVVFGIFMTSILFALMHGNPIQFAHQFVIGVICTTAFFITRSIWAPIIIHMTNNFLAVTGNFILVKINKIDFKMPIWGDIISVILGFAVLFGLFIALYMLAVNYRGDKEYKAPLFKGMKYQMQYLIHNENERAAINYERTIREEQILNCDSEQMKEVMKSALKEQQGKIDKKSRNSIIYALVLALAVWIINTIAGYIK